MTHLLIILTALLFSFLERRTRSESRNEIKSPPPFEQIKKLEDDTARLHTFVHDLEKKLKLKHLLRENEDLKSMIQCEIEKRENETGEIRQQLDTELESLKEKLETQEKQRQTEKGKYVCIF